MLEQECCGVAHGIQSRGGRRKTTPGCARPEVRRTLPQGVCGGAPPATSTVRRGAPHHEPIGPDGGRARCVHNRSRSRRRPVRRRSGARTRAAAAGLSRSGDGPHITVPVPPGEYVLEEAQARHTCRSEWAGSAVTRTATTAVRVLVGESPAASWEMARRPDDDPRLLRENGIFGFDTTLRRRTGGLRYDRGRHLSRLGRPFRGRRGGRGRGAGGAYARAALGGRSHRRCLTRPTRGPETRRRGPPAGPGPQRGARRAQLARSQLA